MILIFSETCGDIDKNFIHVHHLKEISQIGEEYEIDPLKDLRPVCPNCHAILHRQKQAYTIEELKEIMSHHHIL
ncbi:HNH endonuclease [Aeribacillus composti]|uniref:HNH endonuclease n=1 Tax=Aeribacillus composti TaxID=1868734 RepID=UPI002E210C50|nr:HNH endonuclease [Aeribacillus composti]MED0747482.1 HNH endonuclease [Aeribacillus composti]